MATVLKIGPVTRIEGHLDVEVTVDNVGGRQQIVDAKCIGTMFRGFENILIGRDPRDATHLTQRVCGVCPISHAMASSLALEDAFGVVPADNGRIMRNLVLGANYLQSHVLHFYHLAAPDYINTTGILDMSPWMPRTVTDDMVTGATAAALVGHYVQALSIRRKAHQMGAYFAGKMPCAANFVPGGSSEYVTSGKIDNFRTLLSEIRAFIDEVYIPDVQAVAGLFPQYASIGKGSGNLLSYGVFDLNSDGSDKLLKSGRYTEGALENVDVTKIREYVSHSWYASGNGDRNPSDGVTTPQYGKTGAYSWIKSPRYDKVVHEVGPLARMYVNGDYRNGISVIDRIAARALETKKVADACDQWLSQMTLDGDVYVDSATPSEATGVGLTEAPRGALGHWVKISKGKIGRYQIITPTAWNSSPLDDDNQHGAMEQALIGTPINDSSKPIEVLRVIHSFDPCLSCSVHMARPGEKAQRIAVPV